MGQTLFVCENKHLKDKEKAVGGNDDPEGAPRYSGCQVYMLVIAIDYDKPKCENPPGVPPLSCSQDGDNMKALWEACGMPQGNLTSLYHSRGNKGEIRSTIEKIGQRCAPNDYFIFYFSGHGTTVDENGVLDSDDAFCTVTPDGKSLDCLNDDEFAEAITSSIHEDVKIIVLSDCCHSGTICDFQTIDWGNHKACSLSGCRDDQESDDLGKGSVFTHSLLLSIADFTQRGKDSYSIGQLYNRALDFSAAFETEQDIQCGFTSAAASPASMAWPLMPTAGYSAPCKARFLGRVPIYAS